MPGIEQRAFPTFPGLNSRRFWEQVRVLTAANLKTRYRKTWAGFLWVVLNPLTMYWIQTQVFSRFLKINVDNYAIFLLSGLLPWIFISQTLEMCASLFTWSARMLKAFPVSPLVFLFAQVSDNLINFIAGFVIVLIPMTFLFPVGGPSLLVLPLCLVALAVGVFSMAWLLAMLQVFFADTRFILTFVMSIAFFLTPIFYPVEFVPEGWRWLSIVNPLYILIRPFQLAFGRAELEPLLLATGKAVFLASLLLLAAGLAWRRSKNAIYFRF